MSNADGKSETPRAAVLMIGNELLSGRTRDANLSHIATRLGTRGIAVAEARVVPDDETVVVGALEELRARHAYVLTTGGIGPTHDDITADCVARAFGVPLVVDPEARRRIAEHCEARGLELNESRLRMARVPAGASLIDNAVSAAPGFRVENVIVMAGVPKIMHAMLEAVLPTLAEGRRTLARAVVCHGLGEGDIAAPLRAIQERHPAVDIGSYPGRVDGRSRVELVARGTDEAALGAVERELVAMVDALGGAREGA